MRTTSVLVAAGAALALAACGSGDGRPPAGPPTSSSSGPSSSPTSSPTNSPSSKPTASTGARRVVPRFPPGTDSQYADPRPRSRLELTDVRGGHHDAYDRVVLQLRGPGVPGWSAQYVSRPRAEGSGEPVRVAGDAFLVVFASGTTYDPDDLAYDFEHRRHVTVPGDGPVRDVHVLGTFEGYTQVVVGVDGEARPFRVFRLADPPRLVVDVRDVGSG